jgi:hypothetical protein
MDKQCSKCKEIKDVEEFFKAMNGKYGRQSQCKACNKAYAQSPERKAYMKAYEQTPKAKAAHKAYAQSPHAKAYHKRHNQSPEMKAYKKAYAQTPEAKASQWAHNQTSEAKAYRRSYQKLYRQTSVGRYQDAQLQARHRGIDFDIPESFHAELIQQPCHYCQGPLSPTGCGMDRMDSSRGYFVGNVVPCCGDCNTMKSDKLSYDEMMLVWDYRRK